MFKILSLLLPYVWVSDPRHTKLYYAARSRILKLYIYHKNYTIIQADECTASYHFFFQVKLSNQPTKRFVALYHKMFESPWHNVMLFISNVTPCIL